MVCPKCGSPIGKKDVFCRRCGYPVPHELREERETPRGALIFTIIVEVAALAALSLFLFFTWRGMSAQSGAAGSAEKMTAEAAGTQEQKPSEEDEPPVQITEPTPTPEPTATPTPEPTPTPTPEPTEPPMPEMSADEVENNVEIIRAEYNDIKNCIAAGIYYEENIYDGLTSYWDSNGAIRCVIAWAGYNGSDYTRYMYYNESGLFFAYYEAYDAHRFYFKNGRLFRWRYCQDCMVPDDAVNFDLEDTYQYRNWEETVKADAEELAWMAP